MEAIDERSIREQRAAIVVFVQAERLRCFLHLVIEETLQGRGDRLKKFVVAIEALDKTDSFKPRTDATVRVQAGRLRSKLRQYYADAPRGAVVIELPNGSYTPLFSNLHLSSSPTAAAHEPAPPATQTRIALAVLKFEDHGANRDQEYFCSGITEELIAALTEGDRLRVVAWTTDRQFQQGNRDFLTVVEGSVRKKDNCLRIAAYLIRVADRSYLCLGPAKSWRVTTERGVRINQNMQALDSQCRVFPRLHAAGSNGIGVVAWGHELHLAWAFTSGRLAGRSAATARSQAGAV